MSNGEEIERRHITPNSSAVSPPPGSTPMTSETITKGWLVCDSEYGCILADAETASKAKWRAKGAIWEDMDELFSLRVKRRKELDGLTVDEAHRVVWPCKQDPCPGCPCCEVGVCGDDN
jgi:hypothetical protein